MDFIERHCVCHINKHDNKCEPVISMNNSQQREARLTRGLLFSAFAYTCHALRDKIPCLWGGHSLARVV